MTETPAEPQALPSGREIVEAAIAAGPGWCGKPEPHGPHQVDEWNACGGVPETPAKPFRTAPMRDGIRYDSRGEPIDQTPAEPLSAEEEPGAMGSAGRPAHRPSKVNVIDRMATMHPHQWRTDQITDGWMFAIQTCAVAGCGVVRRVPVSEPPR